jgi:prolyl oligopeptidase
MTFAPKSSALGTVQSLVTVSRDSTPLGRISLRGGSIASPVQARLVEQATYSIDTDFTSGRGVRVVGDRLFVQYQAGGPSEVRVYSLTGKPIGSLSLPPICAVKEIVAGPGGEALVEVESFTTPAAWYVVRAGSLELAPTDLRQTSPADFSDYEVLREFAISKDGTKVPLNIIRRRGMVLDGTAPTLLRGYGGYGLSQTPTFTPRNRVFLEQGGVVVVANIRGGGEFGEAWHLAGNLTRKQNVFDDFFAAATWLIEHKYTRHSSLALMGGSNGGLLMGAVLTQHPDLCRAVVSSVGIYDMMRTELSANGEFNVTEFGSVKDPAQCAALRAYSPYHNVHDGTTYPNILFLTGANDPRVEPMQSRKMTARLQQASPHSLTLLRTSANSGHGIGSSLNERIEQNADIYAFLFDQLGVASR